MNIAVITGASSGIGREFVLQADRLDGIDQIWVIARRRERLEELAGTCTHQVVPIPLDLAKDGSAEEYQALLEKEKPRISLLVNAAGCGYFGPFAECDIKAQENCIKLNTIALMAMCRVSLPYMDSGCSIINVGSNSAWQPVPYQSVYGASKAAVLSFSSVRAG